MKVTNRPMYEKLMVSQNEMKKEKNREQAEEILNKLASNKKAKNREDKKNGFLGYKMAGLGLFGVVLHQTLRGYGEGTKAKLFLIEKIKHLKNN